MLQNEFNLSLYESPHGLGVIGLVWNNVTSHQEGACWDCMRLPIENKPTQESPQPLYEAAAAAPSEDLKVGAGGSRGEWGGSWGEWGHAEHT